MRGACHRTQRRRRDATRGVAAAGGKSRGQSTFGGVALRLTIPVLTNLRPSQVASNDHWSGPSNILGREPFSAVTTARPTTPEFRCTGSESRDLGFACQIFRCGNHGHDRRLQATHQAFALVRGACQRFGDVRLISLLSWSSREGAGGFRVVI